MGNIQIFLCGCGWKLVSDIEGSGLIELKNDTLSNRKFRCPLCGFAITPRKTKDPQSEIEKSRIEKEMIEDNKRWLEDSLKKQAEFIKEIKDGEEDSDQ